MPPLFLRVLPWLLGAAVFLVAEGQWRYQELYPWMLFFVPLLWVIGVFLISWQRIRFFALVEKMVPSFFLFAACIVGALMLESTYMALALSITCGLVCFLSLELLFALVRDPVRYPVNGLSRFNLALIPMIGFLAAASLNGLLVFVRLNSWIPFVVLSLVCGILYVVTVHSSAGRSERMRWFVIGMLVGLHTATLVALLPIPLFVHGALTALIWSFPLRVRRYAYQPLPPRSIAWSEAVLLLIGFGALLFTAKWA